MNTHNQDEILTLAIDVEHLLQGVYAESAWRKMCKIEEDEPWTLVDADRKVLLMAMVEEVFVKTCSLLGAYVKGNNLPTFRSEGMLKLYLTRYKPLTEVRTMQYSTLVEQYMLMQLLAMLYVQESTYSLRAKECRRSLLGLFAFDEQT